MSELVERYQIVVRDLAKAAQESGRDPASIRLIAVSKTKPFAMIEELYRAGHRDFGENYVQELVSKAEEARTRGLSEIRWHFIGHLQTNKVKALIPHVEVIHSVDSEKLLREIDKRAVALGVEPIRILVEVNLDAEASKTGVTPENVSTLVTAAKGLSRARIEGLMAIPNPARSGGAVGAFRRLAELARGAGLKELSMGMTSDFEVAIREGSTFIRVGTAIFGEREQN